MSSSPKKTNDSGPQLKLVKPSDDPMEARRADYQNALDALPKRLQQPLANFVKQHVEMELAPAPVTESAYKAHLLLVLASISIAFGVLEIERATTVGWEDMWHSFSVALAVVCVQSVVSLAFAVLMRIQTRKFRLSANFVAVGLAALSCYFIDKLVPFIYFYVPNYFVATIVVETLYVGALLFWTHWFLRNALPTSRPKMVKVLNLTIAMAIGAVLCFRHFEARNGEDTLPRVYLVPFAAGSGEDAKIETVLPGVFSTAVARAKSFAGRFVSSGNSYLWDKKYDKAAASFDEAIRIDPKSRKAFEGRARARLELGEYEKAITDVERAIKLDPRETHLYYLKGKILMAGKDWPAAISAFEIYIAKEEKSSRSLQMKAVAQYYSGNASGALKTLEEAMGISPKGWEVAVWKEIVGQEVPGYRSQLKEQAAGRRGDSWSASLLRYFAGAISEEALVTVAGRGDERWNRHRIHSAEFFIGQRLLLNGDHAGARARFEKVKSAARRDSDEWVGAMMELERMNERKPAEARK